MSNRNGQYEHGMGCSLLQNGEELSNDRWLIVWPSVCWNWILVGAVGKHIDHWISRLIACESMTPVNQCFFLTQRPAPKELGKEKKKKAPQLVKNPIH